MKIPYSVRNQHIYIPGKTRHGKSTLIGEMALQDIEHGAGVCVIDPKGDLADYILDWIPPSRKDDCIYIDPENPVPIQFFDYSGEREKQTVVGELKHIITKGVSTEGAPLMNSMLNDVIYTLLEAKDNGADATFLDIHDFLAFTYRRDEIMPFVKSKRYQARWEEMPPMKERQPTLTRMNDFISSAYLRTVLGCPKPELNLNWIMQNRKILLVNLGGIDEPSQLLATLIIAKIHQLMKRRGRIRNKSLWIPFHLYVDEFGFFQTKEFAEMLSLDGGFGLRLVLANQYLSQIRDVWDAIYGNVGSYVIFCLSPEDARHFRHLSDTSPNPVQLSTLRKHWAFYAIAEETMEYRPTPPPRGPSPHSSADYIRERMTRDYVCKEPLKADNSGDERGQPPTPPGIPLSDAGPHGAASRYERPRRTGKPEPPLPRRQG